MEITNIRLAHIIVFYEDKWYVTSPFPNMANHIDQYAHHSGISWADNLVDRYAMLDSLHYHGNKEWKQWVDNYDRNRCLNKEMFGDRWYLYPLDDTDTLKKRFKEFGDSFCKIIDGYTKMNKDRELNFIFYNFIQTLDDHYVAPVKKDDKFVYDKMKEIQQIYVDSFLDCNTKYKGLKGAMYF